MKKFMTSLPFRLSCLIITVILICAVLSSPLSLSLSYTPANNLENRDILSNPYCGFYRINGYTLTDDVNSNIINSASIAADTGNHRRLVQLQINLRNFKDSALTGTALKQLDDILAAWAQTDKHFILRFLYDWDGNVEETEPKNLGIIIKHMEQTASVYNKYADHIYMLQGLYIGNYGEMHHSSHQSTGEIMRLTQTLFGLANPSIFLAVRTPAYWRTITDSMEPSDISTDTNSRSLAARVSLFNDGLLASESDAGTYAELDRETELSFQNRLCQYVPNGGEVIIDNPYNDLSNAIRDLRTMHISYLNEAYDPNVLNKWKNTMYSENDLFYGLSGYDYIAAHLGYRYVLRSTELKFNDSYEKTATYSLSVENTGFSNCYYPFELSITIMNKATRERVTLINEKDATFFRCGTTNTISFPLNIRDFEPGDYNIYFLTSDPTSKEAIQYANNMTLTPDGYYVGSFSIN